MSNDYRVFLTTACAYIAANAPAEIADQEILTRVVRFTHGSGVIQ
jgi:hypothetical protein